MIKMTKEQKIKSIYSEYPRKVAPKNAYKAIEAALKEMEYEELLDITKQYYQSVKDKLDTPDKRYIPHPATWYNRGSYMEDPKEWKGTNENRSNNDTGWARSDETRPEEFRIHE